MVRLALALGATVVSTGRSGSGIDDDIEAHAVRLRAAGLRPYAMPRGGSTAVGARGFASAAHELDAQLRALGVEPAAVVCAVGSGGSYAGLLCGAAELGWPWPVVGASVSRPLAEMRSVVEALASSAASSFAPLDLVDALGPGHGLVDDSHRALMATALRTAGLLLDPTYTAKALQVAIGVARRGRGPVVFWHTGGLVSSLGGFL
jgi:D-cysteine desulfhydrase